MAVTNVLDAFRALEDLEDEDVEFLKQLKESRAWNVRSSQEMKEAEEYIQPEEEKEVELKVIDPDADAFEHLKDNKEYVGQMILNCTACRANTFVDMDKVVESEEGVYNVDMVCPHCKQEGKGFTLVGQVGAVAQEEEAEEEPLVDNDIEAEEEIKFDLEPEPEEKQPEEEPQEEEAKEEELPEQPEEEELAYDETKIADDTEDLEAPKLGDEVEEIIKYDDTEELPEEEKEESEEEEVEEENPEEEKSEEDEDSEFKRVKEEEKEVIEEAIEVRHLMFKDLLNRFVDPEHLKHIEVFDLNSEDPEAAVFAGKFEELPIALKDIEIIAFGTDGSKLTLNIDSGNEIDPEKGDLSVGDVLHMFKDEFNAGVSLWDEEIGDELYEGTSDSIIDAFGDMYFIGFECPERLQIFARDIKLNEAFKQEYIPVLDMSDPRDELISAIFTECNLKEGRIAIDNTPEYWIAQSIYSKEDLPIIYEKYVRSKSEHLANQFKEVTGYKDAFDEAMELSERDQASMLGDAEEAAEKAQELMKAQNAYAIIYGYQKNGRFYAIKEPLVCSDERAYKDKAEIVRFKFRPTGSIHTLFKAMIEESIDVNSRKELSKLITECQNANEPYRIKSKGGAKYTLIRQRPQNLDEALEEEEIAEDEILVDDAMPDEVCEKAECEGMECNEEIKPEEFEHEVEIEIEDDREEDLEPEEEPEGEEGHEPEQPEEEEFIEFDEKPFEDFINKYLDESCEETAIFECKEGYMNEDQDLVICGDIHVGADNAYPVIFTLKPIEEGYEVKNSLGEEVLTYPCLKD